MTRVPGNSEILLFESDADCAEDVRKALSGFGYDNLSVVSDSDTLRDIVAINAPALIMVGISLAGRLDCLEVVTEIGSRMNIPLIHLSAYAYADLFCGAQISNPYAFLQRPFNSIQLGYAIEVALNGPDPGDAASQNNSMEDQAFNAELIRINSELQREVEELKKYEKVLLHQANHDSLTGLPNRQLLFDRLHQATAYVDRNGSMLALMLIDLDNFKPVNDTMGHVAGDALLRGVAGRLQACLRKYDTVARFGGDEFVIIVNDMPELHDIAGFADKVLDKFRHPFEVLGKAVSVRASIGLAIYPLQSRSPDSLLKMADSAMYQVKNDGGNDYRFFSELMGLKPDKRILMENRLRAALDRDEFLAHYQPRIDVATRRITGMEALMRWQPLDEPMNFPADFFTTLEESGLIVPVGEWLLEKICRQNRAWREAGLPALRVAVNVSERQFSQDDFADGVARALSRSSLDPALLEIELPEQIVMQNVVESVSRLRKLKSTGVTVSLDNFGTGYSSLTHLNRLPIDDIQIDKSLVNSIISDQNDADVVSAIISMGHSLGKNMIAEGVESEEQFMFLAQRRCKEMQGHFFSRPLTAVEFEKLARKYTL